jgi:hypothetical protein
VVRNGFSVFLRFCFDLGQYIIGYFSSITHPCGKIGADHGVHDHVLDRFDAGIPRGVYHFSESWLAGFLDADHLRKLHCALSRADSRRHERDSCSGLMVMS